VNEVRGYQRINPAETVLGMGNGIGRSACTPAKSPSKPVAVFLYTAGVPARAAARVVPELTKLVAG